MAYKIHRAAIVLKDTGNGEVYIGVKYPTPELEKLALIAGKELEMETFESFNLRGLKSLVNKRGRKLSKEDGIPYVSNL